MDQFIDMCILSGCDYCDSIKGISVFCVDVFYSSLDTCFVIIYQLVIVGTYCMDGFVLELPSVSCMLGLKLVLFVMPCKPYFSCLYLYVTSISCVQLPLLYWDRHWRANSFETHQTARYLRECDRENK